MTRLWPHGYSKAARRTLQSATLLALLSACDTKTLATSATEAAALARQQQCSEYSAALNRLYAARSRLSPVQLQTIFASFDAGVRVCTPTAVLQPYDSSLVRAVITME